MPTKPKSREYILLSKIEEILGIQCLALVIAIIIFSLALIGIWILSGDIFFDMTLFRVFLYAVFLALLIVNIIYWGDKYFK